MAKKTQDTKEVSLKQKHEVAYLCKNWRMPDDSAIETGNMRTIVESVKTKAGKPTRSRKLIEARLEKQGFKKGAPVHRLSAQHKS